MFFVNIVFFLSKIHGHSEKMAVYFFVYLENHRQCWWFPKALSLHRLFIRAKRGIK